MIVLWTFLSKSTFKLKFHHEIRPKKSDCSYLQMNQYEVLELLIKDSNESNIVENMRVSST